jgi:histidinol dehydrogenase
MKIFEAGRDPQADIDAALAPPEGPSTESVRQITRDIIADVRARGDESLLELGKRFDSPNLTTLAVTEAEIEASYSSVSSDVLTAMRRAKSNIEDYHRRQLRQSWINVEDGRTVGQIIRPIERVGLYAPGGKAAYPSTVLMTAVPAKVAGVSYIAMCSPAQADGNISPLMLVAAREAGVDCIFKVGGAQAVVALAYGTATLPKVDLIVGPGNPFVTEAKRQVYGTVAIDMMAGPSEVMIVADDTADPVFVATDLLSQAEHAEDSRAVLVTMSRALADRVLTEVKRLKTTAPRQEIITKSLSENGVVVIVRDMDEAAALVNQFAPEHLELLVSDPWALLPKIKNAGAIMMGAYSPVPLGDYAAGPSHTLPTGGTARFSSPVTVDDFLKKSSLISYTKEVLSDICKTITDIAEAEGFIAHAESVKVRLTEQNPDSEKGEDV